MIRSLIDRVLDRDPGRCASSPGFRFLGDLGLTRTGRAPSGQEDAAAPAGAAPLRVKAVGEGAHDDPPAWAPPLRPAGAATAPDRPSSRVSKGCDCEAVKRPLLSRSMRASGLTRSPARGRWLIEERNPVSGRNLTRAIADPRFG